MAWPDVLGHEHVFDTFRRALRQGRLASTFLFVGPPGVGKWTTAKSLAQALLCESTARDKLNACQACPGCRQVAAKSHPDLILVRKPEDRSFIPIELFIGDRDHRMRVGLCHDIALKPQRGGRRIAIIDDADSLNQEGANCLLKTLEEPPANSLIFLVGTSQQQQLPTIRSRCQIVRFGPLSQQHVAQLLRQRGLIEDDSQAESLAARANGSLSQAIELADPDLEEARQSLLKQLALPDFNSVALAKELSSFVDAAGKEVPARRARLRQVVQAAATFYRHLMRFLAGAGPSGDQATDRLVDSAHGAWNDQSDAASHCLDRCLDALNQIDANANLATLVAGWIDDLSQITLHR